MDIRTFFKSRKRKHSEVEEADNKIKPEIHSSPIKKRRKIESEETLKIEPKETPKIETEETPKIPNLCNKKDIKTEENDAKSNEMVDDNNDTDDQIESDCDMDFDEDDYDNQLDTITKKTESIILSKPKKESLKQSHAFDISNKDKAFDDLNTVPYSLLATMFDALNATRSRLDKIELMSSFFRRVLFHSKSLSKKKDHEIASNLFVSSVYLCLSVIAPPYEGIELGVGDTVIMKAICESTGKQLRDIKAEHIKVGDLGDVATQCRRKQNTLFPMKALTINHVFNTFLTVSKLKGNGSQKEKTRNIQKLFVAANNMESRYIVRHLQGKLRIGVNEQTVLAALGRALAFHKLCDCNTTKPEKSLQKIADLEAEYTAMIKSVVSELPNYEIVIPSLLKYGICNLSKHCHLMPGIPIKAMLAKPSKGISEFVTKFEKLGLSFTMEYKYDGERAQIHLLPNGEIRIFSRNAENNSGKFPELCNVENFKRFIAKPDELESFIIDCEVVAFDREQEKILPFQTLSKRKRKDVAAEDIKILVCIYAFDCLLINGKSLLNSSLLERRNNLHESFKQTKGEFHFAHYHDIDTKQSADTDEISQYLDQSIADNCEGLMIKALEKEQSFYEPSKRSHNWLKCKKDYIENNGCGDSLDLVVMGADHGSGKRVGNYGCYTVGCYNADEDSYESCCKVGTGFKDQELIDLTKIMKEFQTKNKPMEYECKLDCDVWFEPKIVFEIKCADFTISPLHQAAIGLVHESKGIALRFPRYVRLREDKKCDQATSNEQIREMYASQAQIAC